MSDPETMPPDWNLAETHAKTLKPRVI